MSSRSSNQLGMFENPGEYGSGEGIAHLHRTIIIPLVDRDGEVPKKSGLNWGQREDRDPDQAYFNIPSTWRKGEFEDFFPPKGVRFQIYTDDGEILDVTRGQSDAKAIMTKVNATLGQYIRKRIGVASGEIVTSKHLHVYSRLDVCITKIGENQYWMEFQKPSH